MPQKYYNVKTAAEALGVSEAEIRQLLDRHELHGYRDGADWKFKSEDVEALVAQRRAAPPAPAAAPPPEEGADVLASEHELGQSDPGLSGTVIGLDKGKSAVDSDIRLAPEPAKPAESDIRLGEEKPAAARKKDEVAAKVSQFEELDLTLDQDLSLEDSTVASKPPAKPAQGDSAVDLSGKKLEDDDLVLGGGGTGSDVSIGGDSGISLVDPADSGLSLEAPLDLAKPAEDSLELGEEDLLSFSSDTGSAALKSEDDFQLTPMEEGGEGEESESGSQVIALDTESESEDAATLIASGGSMTAMLEEDVGGLPAAGAALLAPAAGEAGLATGDALALDSGLVHPALALPEAPYTIWNIVSLVLCSLILMLVGMMMFDLIRNMWSSEPNWHGVHSINSAIMDTILSWFEK
jgi:excisionase family DNA binding protein